MAIINNRLELIINPAMPVQEICEVISAVSVFYPGHELEVLKGVQGAIGKRISELEHLRESQSAE